MRFLAFILAAFVTLSTHAAEPDAPQRFKVPLRDAAVRGPADAKITIVEFADFQCPFSSRVQITLSRLQEKYGRDLRIAFKHNPLPFHREAFTAAEAALAAGAKGKFWEMHDQLFAHQAALDRDHLEQYAKELGVTLPVFKADLDSRRWRAQIEADKAEAENFSVRGTPSFFINGRKLIGAQPFEEFDRIIAEELKLVDGLLTRGTPRKAIYETITKDGLTKGIDPAPPGPKPVIEPKAVGIEARNVTHLGNSPQRGPADAKVTIVEFAEFQCPFSARAAATMDQILKTYPKDVRLIFKHQPLSFHPMAMPAALASEAARHQDRFWEFHDRAFANYQNLSPENFERWVTELGMDVDQYRQAIVDSYTKETVEADSAYGTKLTALGTPTFFVNGRMVEGAVPFETFKTIIDEELRHATTLTAKGIRSPELYQRLIAENVEKYGAAHVVNTNSIPVDRVVKHVPILDSPTRGSNTAPVTIVMWSDFQCPFCARAQKTIRDLERKYGQKLRIVFKNQPLPFHPDASLAAQAALAAGEQGRFWLMHDTLFEHQQKLKRVDLEQYARDLVLDLPKFRRALDSGKFKTQIERDVAYGISIGAGGTPTFFINGRMVVGAQPTEVFEKLVDEELQHAAALTAKGVRPQEVYDAIMREANVAPAEPPAPTKENDGEPLEEADVLGPPGIGIDASDSPSRGPEDAKVTVIAFLNFASESSTRSMDALKRLLKESTDVRVVVKNLPSLDPTPEAMQAALAVDAARQQGKFWAYADIVLTHQSEMSHRKLEQWARSLGLNLSKFRAAMKSDVTHARVMAEHDAAIAAGAEEDPTFFINGQLVDGTQSDESFRALISRERDRATQLMNDGTHIEKLRDPNAPGAELHE